MHGPTFTHHWLPDLRWLLMAATLAVFGRTRVYYTPRATERWMPLPVAFVLIGGFVWLAENIPTFLGAWAYPDQLLTWRTVHLGKITSWSLLVIVTMSSWASTCGRAARWRPRCHVASVGPGGPGSPRSWVDRGAPRAPRRA